MLDNELVAQIEGAQVGFQFNRTGFVAACGCKGKGAPPVGKSEVRKLVAGGVERLSPDRVRVMLSRAEGSVATLEEPELTSVGPVAVAPESKTILQAVIGLMGFIIVVLGGGIVYLLWRRMATAGESP